MGTRPARNEPCPCGSGKKYKKCCLTGESWLPTELAEIVSLPCPLDLSALESLEIREPDDIGPYLDAVVGSFKLFHLPRVEALLHSLRALHCQDIVQIAFSSIRPEERVQYGRMRRAQDLLRYLVYEIFTRCIDCGEIRPSSLDEIKLADATIDEFAKLSELRDAAEALKRGWGECKIDPSGRIVIFERTPQVARFSALRQEGLDRRLHRAESASITQELSPRLIQSLISTIDVDPKSRSFTYKISTDLVASSVSWVEEISRLGCSDPLPAEWSVGPYTIGEFRRFYLLLTTWVTVHNLVLVTIANKITMPINTTIPTPTIEEIVEFMEIHGGLASTTTREIVRDITYDPPRVKWTDIQYQPLLPLSKGRLALTPVVITGSNFERNLLAIVDKLPWRRGGASELTSHREEIMIEEIWRIASPKGILTQPRVNLRDRRRIVGDIDMLMWDSGGQTALSIQLKWFFGPDSIHETWSHAEWYRRGGEKHLQTTQFLRDNLRRIVSDYPLRGLAPNAELLSILVTKEDEPMETAVPADLPAITLGDFKTFLEQGRDNVRELYEAIEAHWKQEAGDQIQRTPKADRFGPLHFCDADCRSRKSGRLNTQGLTLTRRLPKRLNSG